MTDEYRISEFDRMMGALFLQCVTQEGTVRHRDSLGSATRTLSYLGRMIQEGLAWERERVKL